MATQVTLNSGSVDSAGSLALKSNGTTTAVTIDTSQNVGIGTSSPAGKLDITSGTARMLFSNQSATAFFTAVNTANSAYAPMAINGSQMILKTEDAERMRIDTTGNLLVGTSTVIGGSSAFLHVIDIDGGKNGISVGNSTGSAATVAMRFLNSNGTVGTIITSGLTTAYNTSSDYRLKYNIAPMTGALAKVAALKPVTHKWKADGSEGEGFIAHELAEVCPHAVTGEKDAVDADGKPQYQSIDTSFLVATLTAAIQELKTLVDTQASTIQSLTTRITALEAK